MGVGRLGLLAVLAVAACAPAPASRTSAVSSMPPSAAPVLRDQPGSSSDRGVKAREVPVLVGLLSRDVEGLFGRPSFVRRDGPAQIWQYGNQACTLNLFFYRDGAVLKVKHVEFRDRNADLTPSGRCDGIAVSMVQRSS